MQHDVAVVIPSKGRPGVLRATIESLLAQDEPPTEIVVSIVAEADFPHDAGFPPSVRWIVGRPGAAAQRNSAIEALKCQPLFVVFLDDDMELHRGYLRGMREFFEAHPQAVVAMGHLLANGGVTLEEAKRLCANPPDLGDNTGKSWHNSDPWGGAYGCNLVARASLLDQVRFDERLPLYSEMEDVDFGNQARRHGEVWYLFGCLAVHLRTAGARITYRRHGFSQVMNAVYLGRKGSIPLVHAIRHFMLRRPLQNLVLAALPSQRQRRLGLFRGNLDALSLILRGRIEPEAILNIPDT
jgi:GT2 family glycosyltransferase